MARVTHLAGSSLENSSSGTFIVQTNSDLSLPTQDSTLTAKDFLSEFTMVYLETSLDVYIDLLAGVCVIIGQAIL